MILIAIIKKRISNKFYMRSIISLLPLFLISCIIAGLAGCNTTEPNNDLQINVEDVSCTEAWINVTGQTGNEVILNRDDKEVQRFILTTSPQIIYDDSLLPNKSYNYQAIRNNEASNKTTVTTLDTTSSNYSWQTLTFGGAASSSFEDVAIVNENDIWAVGTIFVYDSTGQVDPNIYNAVHWDGNKWELKRVPYYYQGQAYYHPIQSIYSFALNDVLFCGNGIIHWDGLKFNEVFISSNVLGSYQINRIWGKSSNDFFIVGNSGKIAHFQNGSWQKIESGTELNINDIWGTTDYNGNNNVLCSAYNFGSGGGKKLLRIQGTNVDTIGWTENRELYTVWFNTTNKIYAGGEGLFVRVNEKWKEENLPPLFKFRIRGTSMNNVWTVGGYGLCAKFNGKRWITYNEVSLSSGNYEALDVKDNIVVVACNEGNSTVITIGIKN